MKSFIFRGINHGASSEITKEGYKLDKEGISFWLISKNIIGNEDKLLEFSNVHPWARMGGETYGSIFCFKTENISKQIFIKALVTSSPEKAIQDWDRRKNILKTNTIPVSNWYWFGNGIIIEDYYPNHAIGNVSFNLLLSIGYKLDQLGFETLKFIDDIRSDSNGNPHYVDFGFDLGEPTKNKKNCAKEYLIREYKDKTDVINSFYK